MNHMNGRVEDATTGRMLSADPYVPDPTNAQSYNRYSYANSNPLTLVDPSGFDGCGSDNKDCLPVVTVVGSPPAPAPDNTPPPPTISPFEVAPPPAAGAMSDDDPSKIPLVVVTGHKPPPPQPSPPPPAPVFNPITSWVELAAHNALTKFVDRALEKLSLEALARILAVLDEVYDLYAIPAATYDTAAWEADQYVQESIQNLPLLPPNACPPCYDMNGPYGWQWDSQYPTDWSTN
jgi:hypothetical protein